MWWACALDSQEAGGRGGRVGGANEVLQLHVTIKHKSSRSKPFLLTLRKPDPDVQAVKPLLAVLFSPPHYSHQGAKQQDWRHPLQDTGS